MRMTFAGSLLFIGLVTAGRPAPAASPAKEAEIAADFLLASCLGSVDDLSTVDRLAQQNNWKSVFDPAAPSSEPVRINGVWRVSQNGRLYTVTTGSAVHGGTSCLVVYDEPRPARDGFLSALARGLTLTSVNDFSSTHGRREQFEIEVPSQKKPRLQMTSSHGLVFEAAIVSAP